MNKNWIAAVIAITVAIAAFAPVIASKAKSAPGKCGPMMKYDKKSKTCHWRI